MATVRNNHTVGGQILLETVISLAILLLVVFGSLTAVITSVKNTTFARNKSLATQYANECLEDARQVRNNNWDDLNGACSTCSQCGSVGPFNRRITISTIDADQKKAEVNVIWEESGREFEVNLTSLLFNL